MSKYSKKIEEQLRTYRRVVEENNRESKAKKLSRQFKIEKKRTKNLIKLLQAKQDEEFKKENEIIQERRALRKDYLESLKNGNVKQKDNANDRLLKFDIYRWLEENNTPKIDKDEGEKDKCKEEIILD